jgi:hypothetical protein
VTMATPRMYEQCGMRLRAPLDLRLPEATADDWDVDVTWGADLVECRDRPDGELVAELALDDGAWWYRATWTGSEYHLRFFECGDFIVSADLDAVEIRSAQTDQSAILPVLMAGTVTSFLLTLRGSTVLHASGVELDGRALAFVGPSGQGKTTLATLVALHGARLLTDDVLTVDPGPPVTCLGGATELRLREAAASLADTAPAGATRRTADDRMALTLERAPAVPYPLAAIVVPNPSRTDPELQLTLVEPSLALMAMLAIPRVYGWATRDVLARDFATLSALTNAVPVYKAVVPWGPPFDPTIAEALTRLLAEPTPS